MRWENLDESRRESAHYSVMRRVGGDGMQALREMFPDGEANEMNFALFSTSGVHGTYNTIEEAEAHVLCGDMQHHGEVTFVIVHPRLVALRYGNCEPQAADDFEFLKKLRASSVGVVAEIGKAP